MKCKRDVAKKKKIKTMNSKMTTNSQLSTTKPKKQKQTKQTNRTGTASQNGHHMEGYQWGGGGRERGNRYGE